MKLGRALVGLALGLAGAVGVAGCGAPTIQGRFAAVAEPTVAPTPFPTPELTTPPPPAPTTAPPKPKSTTKTNVPAGADTGGKTGGTASDGVPSTGSGAFAATPGGTGVAGTGVTLKKYRTEVETGITWGANPVWTPESFGAAVDTIMADPRGWIASAQAPITDPAQHMSQASWSFQRTSGADYDVRLLLATPATVDRMCGSVGLQTVGQYSCRYGKTILINLRRWLKGASGFPIDLAGYRTMVINHEMGHLLGFSHMTCGSAGTLVPVMAQETINLGGCLPNKYPFAPDGTFVSGPWAA
jgi:hypothetical protein